MITPSGGDKNYAYGDKPHGVSENKYVKSLLDYNNFYGKEKETDMIAGSLANPRDRFTNYADPSLDETPVRMGIPAVEAVYSDKGMLNALDNFFKKHRSLFDQQANIGNFRYSQERGNRPQMMEVNATGKQGDYDTSLVLGEHRNYLQNTIPPEVENFSAFLKGEYKKMSERLSKGNLGTVQSEVKGDADRQYSIISDQSTSSARNHNEKGVYGSEGSFRVV